MDKPDRSPPREPTAAPAEAPPIPMILRCPYCHAQHVDAPDEAAGWTNPPHRSHLCHSCGAIWRPADVPTTGIRAIETRGEEDRAPEEAPQGDDLVARLRSLHIMDEVGSDNPLGRDAAARIESDAARIRELEADNANKADHVRILERRVRDLTEEKNCAAIDLAASRERERALREVLLDIANVSDTDCEEGDGAFYIRDLARTAIKRLAAPDSAASPTRVSEARESLGKLIDAIERWHGLMRDDHTLCKAADAALPALRDLLATPVPAPPAEPVAQQPK